MEEDDQNTLQDRVNITVLLQDGTSELFKISKCDTVSKLKTLIEQSSNIHIPEGKSINILYLGHILNDDSKFIEIQNILNTQFTVNCFFTQKINETQPEDSDSDQYSEEFHGFDRLGRMNYTQQQIRTIRQHFHRMMNSNELTDEQQIDLEEEWFPVLFNSNETHSDFSTQGRREDEIPLFNQQMSRSSSHFNLFVGFCFGMVFGIGICFVMPFFYHNKNMLTGIILGLLLRFTSKMIFIYT